MHLMLPEMASSIFHSGKYIEKKEFPDSIKEGINEVEDHISVQEVCV